MNRNLEARIERLEQEAGKKANWPTVIVISYLGAKDGNPVQLGNLIGYETNGELIERPAEETEKAFAERITAEYDASRRGLRVRVLFERRAKAE